MEKHRHLHACASEEAVGSPKYAIQSVTNLTHVGHVADRFFELLALHTTSALDWIKRGCLSWIKESYEVGQCFSLPFM